jgi:RimJ/RimL family protein N-acetyltransferase
MINEDLSWFLSVRNSVRQYLHNPSEFILEDAQIWFRNLGDLEYYKILHLQENGSHEKIGYIRFRSIDKSNIGEIGLDLDPKYQGLKLSVLAYAEFARENKAKCRVWTLRVRKSNQRAFSLYTKLSFIVVGEFYSNELEENEYLMLAHVKDIASFTNQIE